MFVKIFCRAVRQALVTDWASQMTWRNPWPGSSLKRWGADVWAGLARGQTIACATASSPPSFAILDVELHQ